MHEYFSFKWNAMFSFYSICIISFCSAVHFWTFNFMEETKNGNKKQTKINSCFVWTLLLIATVESVRRPKIRNEKVKVNRLTHCFFCLQLFLISHKPVVVMGHDSRRHYCYCCYYYQVDHRLVPVLLECHNHLLVVQRNAMHVDRIQVGLDNVEDVDNHLDTANNDYTIYPMQHYHLDLHCTMLYSEADKSNRNWFKNRKKQFINFKSVFFCCCLLTNWYFC